MSSLDGSREEGQTGQKDQDDMSDVHKPSLADAAGAEKGLEYQNLEDYLAFSCTEDFELEWLDDLRRELIERMKLYMPNPITVWVSSKTYDRYITGHLAYVWGSPGGTEPAILGVPVRFDERLPLREFRLWPPFRCPHCNEPIRTWSEAWAGAWLNDWMAGSCGCERGFQYYSREDFAWIPPEEETDKLLKLHRMGYRGNE